MPAPVSRRRFLAGALAAAAACTADRAAPQATGSIAVANFPFYIDAGTNPGFTTATGIAVAYHEEVVDDETWFASVQPRLERGERIERDVVVVSEWLAARMARRGFVEPLDVASIPNAAHVDPGAVRQAGSLPWAQGMVGVAYDTALVGGELHRLAELFQPPLRGRVALPTDARLAIGVALLADGVDPASATASDIATSAGHLANSVKLGQVLPFDGTPPVRRLAAGDAAAAVVRASDVVGLDHANPTLRFVLPDEGGLLLTDVAVIPRRADNRDGAVRYLDYVCDPDHAAARFRSVPALWPIDGVEARLRRDAPDVAADPRRNPSLDARARLHRFVELSDDGEAELADAFAGVVRAAG